MSQFPIIGASFRPPAAGLLTLLASGTPLVARREASNAHDANAIMVLVAADVLPENLPDHNVVDEELRGYGSGYEQLVAQPEWHLGYIPRTDAAALAPHMDAAGTSELLGQLTFNAAGQPRIQLEGELA